MPPITGSFGALTARGFGLFSAPVALLDEYFENVTMLLPGNGTNGAQNNTFLDSSTNNFTITRNGNTTQGTFTPYGANWSNYFNGSTDYFTVPTNAAFQFGTGDFTIECWINKPSAANGPVVDARGSAVASPYAFYVDASNFPYFYDGTSYTSTVAIVNNQWNHIAVVRTSSVLKIFVNGVQGYSASYTTALNPSATVYLGGQNFSSPAYTAGYISNLRIVKGTAVYTSAFTPPTAPLTAISGTSLLTCQSNRFIDNSSNAFAITRNGSPSVQRFSPFSPTAAYDSSTIGGSGYFDGSVDRLSIAGNNAFDISSGDFTLETWVYPTSNANFQSLFLLFTATNINYAGMTISVSRNTNSTILVEGASASVGGGSPAFSITTTNTAPINAWSHIAVTRSGNTFTVWINGVSSGTATFTGTLYWSPPNLYIGNSNDSSASPLTGYLSNFRLVKGTAVYTAGFTPPSSPVTSISGAQVLLNFTNTGIIDNAMMNDLETVGNAQISTAQSKFGGGSIAFDGNGDGLYRPYSELLTWRTGNFTVEFWMYFSSKTGYQTIASLGYGPAVTGGWIVQTGNGDGKIVWYYQGAASTAIATDAGSTVNTGQWYHIAIVRNGTTTTIYRDGTSVGSGTDTNDYNPANTAVFYIGGGSNTGFNNFYFNGYIDDLRITKGVARYTANFTPPTQAFPTR